MEEKKIILRRVYIVYVCCCIFALSVIGRVCYIQFAQGDYWRQEANNFSVRQIDIEAVRGNIFAIDGSLLATSLPYYEVAIDPNANDFLTEAQYRDSIDAMCKELAVMLPAKTYGEYYQGVMLARGSGAQYHLLARNVSYEQLQKIRKFPLFRLGRYKGGLIYVQTNKRERPFHLLASRTIGYSDSTRGKVGLEGAYDGVLTGVSGRRLMRKIAGGVWMPVNNDNEIEPKNGKDIVTTIDINIQDVAENALMTSLTQHDAKYGCVVVMEVQTGEIRAIANLTRQDSGIYIEDYNYAIGDAREPGSTFKLASYLVAMDQGMLHLTDEVDLNGGSYKYYDETMRDSHTPKKEVVTAEEAFWESSNVGVSRLITAKYDSEQEKRMFTDGLHALRFGDSLGLEIRGEGKSRIKNPGETDWSGISLPWISIGYESLITPMQTLTLYNAVANDGVMVKPMFVKEIREKGQTIQKFESTVLNPAIAKPETIKDARKLLEGVVLYGTGTAMMNPVYSIAGKTGTAQVANNGRYKDEGKVMYQASFVGYFPADQPRYTCIVIVNAPSGDVYYGGKVSGPVFKAIADRVYATELTIHAPVNFATDTLKQVPVVKEGLTGPTLFAISYLQQDIAGTDAIGNSGYIATINADGTLKAKAQDPGAQLSNGVMPDVRGMNAADAVYLLENKGFHVRIRGAGTVIRQSIAPGAKIIPSTEIVLELAI